MATALSRAERKLQTRAAVIDAAAALFAKQGIEATSLDRIAGTIGLTKGAVYSTFASKEELIDAVAESRSVLIDPDPLFRADLPLREGLRSIAEAFLTLRPKLTREILCLELEMFLYADRHPRWGRAELRALREARREEADRLEAAAAERGERLPMPAEDFFVALEALLIGIAREQFRDPAVLSDSTIESLIVGLAG
ncbi:MAG TPA: TetR family transcriptional regulator [Actinomycetota bacterium]|nr:TetR family transcriptional regulator [Actinomycetota bacterium]